VGEGRPNPRSRRGPLVQGAARDVRGQSGSAEEDDRTIRGAGGVDSDARKRKSGGVDSGARKRKSGGAGGGARKRKSGRVDGGARKRKSGHVDGGARKRKEGPLARAIRAESRIEEGAAGPRPSQDAVIGVPAAFGTGNRRSPITPALSEAGVIGGIAAAT
jgi:hypothetical protein